MSEDCYEPPTTTLPRGLNLPRHSTLCRITIGYRTRWADLQLSRVLPVLDPTPMGWKQRDWLLGIDQRQLFGRADNIGPALVGRRGRRGMGRHIYRRHPHCGRRRRKS
jgi:hypothetical protein